MLFNIFFQFSISCSPGSVDDRLLSTANLQNMFKCITPGMSPFRILYNLEVIKEMIPFDHKKERKGKKTLFK